MIEFCLCCPQTCLDVSQALPVGQLGKGHAEILVPASETLYLVVSIIAFYALPEIVHGNKIHQLGEYGTTRVHQPSPSARMQKYGLLQNIFSNRFQPSLPAKHRYALMYSLLSAKRWDSSDSLHQISWKRQTCVFWRFQNKPMFVSHPQITMATTLKSSNIRQSKAIP